MATSETSAARPARDSRLNIRTSAAEDALIRHAAQALHKSVSEFVLESATTAAEQTLADRRFFLADERAWIAFEHALDRPAVAKPCLAKLLHDDTFAPEP